MCYLNAKGIVALYPELMFASLSAVRSAAFNDAQNPIEHQFKELLEKGFSPFKIGNLMVTTNHLHCMTCKARQKPEGEMIWRVVGKQNRLCAMYKMGYTIAKTQITCNNVRSRNACKYWSLASEEN